MTKQLKDKIIVQDNFFNGEILNKIKIDISNQNFQNRFTKFKNSIYQKIYFEVKLFEDHFAVQETKKILSNLFKLKCLNIDSQYFLSTQHQEATPHNDDTFEFNCLIYLKGDDFINNGTGFYDKIGNEYKLNTHIGFKENRAIIFDSTIYHTSLQFEKNTNKRYCLANFINSE